MKKLTCLILCTIMLLSLTACSKAEEPKDRLAQIRERGYIELATEPYYAPNEFIDSSREGDEQYVGLDIELAKAIAEKIGVELKITPMEFSAVLASVTENRCDMAISGLAYSDERNEAANLSKGYYFADKSGRGHFGFMVRVEDADKYLSVEDAKNAVIVAQAGSVEESNYKKYIGECKEFKQVETVQDAFLCVKEGKADVMCCDTATGQLFVEANPEVCIPDFRFPYDESTDGQRVAVNLEGTESLMEIINSVIDELRADGTIEEWHDYYYEYAKTLGIDVN